MSHEADIHAAQVLILRELLFRKEAGFTELQKPTKLTSDNFSFHIKRLVELGYVTKVSSGTYKLSPKGKEYANKLDTDNNTIERQPKIAVLLVAERPGKKADEPEFLVQQRLKHPYYGFWGSPTGKIRWGETVIEAAARELMEETGLTANLRYCGIYHEHAFNAESKELLEDKIFLVVHCTDTKGELIKEFEGGANAWMTLAEGLKLEHTFPHFEAEFSHPKNNTPLVEEQIEYTEEHF